MFCKSLIQREMDDVAWRVQSHFVVCGSKRLKRAVENTPFTEAEGILDSVSSKESLKRLQWRVTVKSGSDSEEVGVTPEALFQPLVQFKRVERGPLPLQSLLGLLRDACADQEPIARRLWKVVPPLDFRSVSVLGDQFHRRQEVVVQWLPHLPGRAGLSRQPCPGRRSPFALGRITAPACLGSQQLDGVLAAVAKLFAAFFDHLRAALSASARIALP